MEIGLFLGGTGIHVTAHRLHTADDTERIPLGGAFENRMLNKMRHAHLCFRLITGARIHQHPEMRNRGIQLLMDQPQTVLQPYNIVRHCSMVTF